MKQLFFSLLLYFLFNACNAQVKAVASDSAAQIDEFVVKIFEDKTGNLWFGTMASGAARYDGKKLTFFSVKDGLVQNTVAGLVQDTSGSMWFGTHAGATRYDGKTFTQFGKNEGLHGPGCNFLADKKGTLWAGTNHGVFRYNGTAFVEFKLPNPDVGTLCYKWEAGKIWRMFEDKKGNIWFARDGYGACKFDGTTFTHFTKKDGLCSNNVGSIVEDDAGNIWFGSLSSDWPVYVDEGGVCRYNGKTFTQFPEIEGLHETDIYTLYKDRSGNIWIGAVGIGAYRYDGKKFTLFNKTDREDLIVNFGVQSIWEDRKGTIWFGFSGGLFRFNGTSFTNVTRKGPWK